MQRAATILSAIATSLALLGLVVLYSTSSARSAVPHFYLQRQVAWLLVAVLAGFIVMRIDYRIWRKWIVPLSIVTVLLLILVFVPGIGARVKGSYRWIRLGPFSFQPSELAKLTVIIGMATYMAKYGREGYLFVKGLFIPLSGLVCIACLIMLAPDFGTTATIFFVGMMIMFAGGTRFIYLLFSGLAGLVLFSGAVYASPVRFGRIMSFLWPERYPEQAYHLIQSLDSFHLGRAFGVGLGNSMQKRYYLPEAHTDFIFAIIAEELGFVATLLVLLSFAGFFLCGLFISQRAPDPFGRLLGYGVTLMITVQAAFNIAVVTGAGPTKGLPLPFISYGGSSLVLSVVMTAILLSIARYSSPEGQQGGSSKKRIRSQQL